MKFPILGVLEGNPSTSAVNYAAIGGSLSTWTATESERQIPLSEACTISEFGPTLTNAPGLGKSYKITLRKNGEDTAATVTIEGESTSATPWTGSVSLAEGDLISISITPTGTPASAGIVSTYSYFVTSGESFFVLGLTSTTMSNSAAGFMTPYGATGRSWETVSEAITRIVLPMAGTFTKQAIRISGSPGGAGKKYEISGRLNGSTDFLTATVENTTVAGSATGSQAFSAGDTMTLKAVPSGTPTSRRLAWCFSCTPAVVGESLLGFGWSDLEAGATVYNVIHGAGSSWNGTEANRAMKPPALTVRKFYVSIGTAPGEGKSRTYTLRSNGSATALSVAISGASTTGNYTAGDASITAGQNFDVQSVAASSPASNTGGVHFGFVVATQQGAPLSLAAGAGVAAATLGATAPTGVPLAASAGQAAATLGITAPTATPLAASAGQSAATVGLTAATKVGLTASAGQSNALLTFAKPLPSLSAAGQSGVVGSALLLDPELKLDPELELGGAATDLRLTVAVRLQLEAAVAQSTAEIGTLQVEVRLGIASASGQSGASLGTPTTGAQITPAASAGQSAATLGVTAGTYLLLDPSSGQGSGTLGTKATTFLVLDPSHGVADAELGITGTGALVFEPGEGQSSATLGVEAQTQLPPLSAAGASEASIVLSRPEALDLVPAFAVASAALGVTATADMPPLLSAGQSGARLEGRLFRGMELIDEGRDGWLERGDPGIAHRGRIGDPAWAI